MQTHSKKSKRGKRRKSENLRLETCYIEDDTDIEILYISPLTQIFIGCRIGQDITAINPWIFIEKEKFLDHLDFYGEGSEFYKIADKIMKCPLDNIMIGSCNYNANIPVDFYICTTLEAQMDIEGVMKIKNELMLQKIMNSIYPICGTWASLGSEAQLKEEMNLNNRLLFAVEIETDFPIHKAKTRFDMKLSEEILDGYTELRAGRSPGVRFLWRRRLDRATQVAPRKKNKLTQTMRQACFRQTVQFNPQCLPEYKVTKEMLEGLENFLYLSSKFLCDTLLVNYHLNLYSNDYSELKKHTRHILHQKPVDIKLYQDINCQRTKVSCMSWNAKISGVVAAAYSKNPLLCLSKRIHREEVRDPAVEKHYILIWYYKDNVRPKLYLQAKAEVTALSFCPYDENILVAGYSNGLIAVWDLTNRLIDAETPIFLSDSEQRYHLLMSNQTTWIKRPPDYDHIFPALTSEYQIGHTSPVTSIVWIPPSHYISSMRLYKECDERERHMQFLTVSLDGNKILVWDLKPEKYHPIRKKKSARGIRLDVTPEALKKDVSPLQKIQEYFKPVSKLFIRVPEPRNNNNPLIKMVMKNELYSYTAQNPDTLGDIDAVTYFDVNGLAFDFDLSQKIILTTGLGAIQVAFWEAANYEGEPRDTVCKIVTLPVVHDGPILVCEINRFFPDMLLTVGGSVFAIWDYSKTKNALVWRKSKYRYQSGMWCSHHPLSVLVIRIDRCYEFWNISERSDYPVELTKYKGYDLMKFYGDSTKFHTRKRTFITTDALGAFKVFSLPADFVSKSDRNLVEAMEYIDRLHEFNRYIEELKEKCRQKKQVHMEEPEPDDNEPINERSVVAEPEEVVIRKPAKLTSKVKFEEKLLKHMQDMEINRKRLNLNQIRKDCALCLMATNDDRFDLDGKTKNPEVILDAARNAVLEDNILTNKVRRRITVAISREKADHLKQMYMESFHEIEEEFIKVIKHSNFTLESKFPDHCRSLRRKCENIAHIGMRHLKRKVIIETEADVINVNRKSTLSMA